MRLSAANLAQAKAGVERPRYDRSAVTPGIVHLGIGAFHRAHQAVVVDEVLNSDPSWGIAGASLRRPDTSDALNPQDAAILQKNLMDERRHRAYIVQRLGERDTLQSSQLESRPH